MGANVRRLGKRQMVRILAPSDYATMPWKNGGGRTTEIAVYPPKSTLDTFAWRVSLADVASDGPFSRLPGVDRILVLLDGAGMRFAGDGGEVELRTPFSPYAFRGDDAIDCTLVGGAVRDFNAMFRRGAARGRVSVVRGVPATAPPSDFVVVYAALGRHECRIPGQPGQLLDPHHTMIVDGEGGADPARIDVRPVAPGAVALVVGVDCP